MLTWDTFSKKQLQLLSQSQFCGFFTAKEAEEKNLRLVTAKPSQKNKESLVLYLLVNCADGVITRACYQVWGSPYLIIALEICCGMILGKNYDQISRMQAEMLERKIQSLQNALLQKFWGAYSNLLLEALDDGVRQCLDLPFKADYQETPIEQMLEDAELPDWKSLKQEQKKQLIENILDQEIRPYVEMDNGGIEVRKLDGIKLTIAYTGNCTSCYAATGSTLSAVQNILRAKIHPEMEVIPYL